MEKHLSNPDEREDRNIPDPVELKLYRGRIAEAASRAALEKEPDPAGIWAEAAGPGSYTWLWTTGIKRAPTVLGWAALVICLLATLGGFVDIPLFTGELLAAPQMPVFSSVTLGMVAFALLAMRPGAAESAVQAGVALCYFTIAVCMALLALRMVGIDPDVWGSDALRSPSVAALVNNPALALCLLTIDRDPPRYRWQRALIPLVGIIFLISVILWFLVSFPSTENGLRGSFAGIIGSWLEVLLAPIGFNLQMSIALVPGLAAREVAVSALGTVYAVQGADVEHGLTNILQHAWSLPTALAFLAWYVYAPQCIASLAVLRRETNSWRWTAFAVVYLFALAYVAAGATYWIASALIH